MKSGWIVPVYIGLAMTVGLVVSYYPPVQNGPAIWGLVGAFLGHAARDLFGDGGKQ